MSLVFFLSNHHSLINKLHVDNYSYRQIITNNKFIKISTFNFFQFTFAHVR